MCLNPVPITRELCGRKYTQYVPCGKCNECVKNKQNEYVVRSIEEAAKRGKVWFFTLTYNNDTVPVTFDLDGEIVEENPDTGEVFYADSAKINTLNRLDITGWKKRVRTKLNKRRKKNGQSPLDFGYMICGEYGPKTHRPHYHGLFIGMDKEDVLEFQKDWEIHYGFTNFKYIPNIPVDGVNQVETVSKYCAKYICKMRDLEDENVVNGKVQKPRKQVSVGYGMPTKKKFDQMRNYHLCRDLFPSVDIDKLYELSTVDQLKLVREVIKRRKWKNNGKDYKLPNYYKRKMFYVKDPVSGKVRASNLQALVSKTLEMDVQKDYSRKLAQMAANYENPEDPETYFRASKDLRESERLRREQISEMLFETNIRSLRKSKF